MKKCKNPDCDNEFSPFRSTDKYCSMSCTLDGLEAIEKAKPIKKKAALKIKPLGWHKKRLWEQFALYIKILHSVDGENCNCFTCDKPLVIGTTNCQAGHCLSKADNPALYFDERSVRPQCYYCNINLGGNEYEFNERLKQQIGYGDCQRAEPRQ